MSVAPSDSSCAGRRRVVVVLGMHRSGTSAVAGSLHRLGVDFGPRLMPATPDNPRGYYEHVDIVNLHDRLLLALGGSWDETAALPPVEGWRDDPRAMPYHEDILAVLRRDFPPSPQPWGIKDPRLCRFLPWWEPLWAAMDSAPLFVLVIRPAREVAGSLARRENFSAAKSYLLWLLHTLEAERATRGQPRVFVDFHAFLADPAKALEPVRQALGPSCPVVAGEGADGSEPFIDPTLSRVGEKHSGERLPAWIEQTEAVLRLFLERGDEAAMRRSLDDLREQAMAARELFAPSSTATGSDLRHQLEVTRQQARWYEEEWRKARSRADVARIQLEAKRDELDKARQVVSKLKNTYQNQ